MFKVNTLFLKKQKKKSLNKKTGQINYQICIFGTNAVEFSFAILNFLSKLM